MSGKGSGEMPIIISTVNAPGDIDILDPFLILTIENSCGNPLFLRMTMLKRIQAVIKSPRMSNKIVIGFFCVDHAIIYFPLVNLEIRHG